MATSIFFTESKDFKLIKDRILNHEDNYLVYVYADTTNIRIPKELIMQLPRYGNNLIWVDTAEMDSSDLSHHIVLTIGQLVNPEEEIDFYIVSKSSKLEKTIIFLRNQGIPAEMIAPEPDKPKPEKTKGTGRRGRPKKVQTIEKPEVKTGRRGRPKKIKVAVADAVADAVAAAVPVEQKKRGRPSKVKVAVAEADAVVETAVPVEPKKRGRPSKVKVAVAEADAVVETVVPSEPKKRGRKKIEKPLITEKPKRSRKAAITIEEAAMQDVKIEKEEKKVKKEKKVKEGKQRKQRVDKEITEEMVQDKLRLFETTDSDVSTVMSRLFSLKKVARPKFEAKLIDLIKFITLEDDTTAERIITKLQEMQVLESTGPGGRVFYKD